MAVESSVSVLPSADSVNTSSAKTLPFNFVVSLNVLGPVLVNAFVNLVAWPACITGTSLPSKLPFTTCCTSGVWIVIPLAPSIVICRVVDAPFKSPDFHLPAKPGPPDTRLSVFVCWTDFPSGPVISETQVSESPLNVTRDFEISLPPFRKVNSQDVG